MEDCFTVMSYGDLAPTIDPSVFLAAGCRIVGDVRIGADSSIWFNTVVRGDVHWIRIGACTNIQDLCMLHVTHGTHPLRIGDEVTIGHSVTVHGCTIEDRCLIGMGAVVLDGAVIHSESMVAAGAVVTPGTVVPSGTLYGGIPARKLRELRDDEIDGFRNSAARYVAYAERMRSAR